MASGTITSVTGKTLNLVLTWSTARIAGTRTARLIVEAWIEFTSLECAARSSQSMTLAGEAHTFGTSAINDYTGSLHRVEATSYSDGLGYNEKILSYDDNGNLNSQTVSASWLFAGTYSGTYLGTITASGNVTFDSIEPANTAPIWNGAKMTPSSNVYIPENTGNYTISWGAAYDPGDTLTYYLHRAVYGSYDFTQIWSGTATSYTENVGGLGGQGTAFQYAVTCQDSHGAWVTGGYIYSGIITKNTLNAGSLNAVSNIVYTGAIGYNTLTWGAGSNTNGSGIANYRINCTTSGVPMQNNTETISSGYQLPIYVSGNVPTTPYIRFSDLKAKFPLASGFQGTITLVLTTTNNYGSTKTSTRTVSVDLRTAPSSPVNPTISTNSTTDCYHIGDTDYYIPNRRPVYISWGAATDYLGGTCSYDVDISLNNGATYSRIVTGTTNLYATYSTAVTSRKTTKFKITAKTSFNYSSTGAITSAIYLDYYNTPSFNNFAYTRTTTTVTATGTITLNSSIPAALTPPTGYSIKYIGVAGGPSSVAVSPSPSYTSPTFTVSQQETSGISAGTTYTFTFEYFDSFIDAIFGSARTTSITIQKYVPVFTVRTNGVGVSDIPDGTYQLKVGGKAHSTEGFYENGVKIGGAEAAWPVGSVFISVVSTNPSTLLGFGTWSAFATGRTLVGIDTGQTEFNVVEKNGGSKTHTLGTTEIPSHSHTSAAHTHTITHTHASAAHTHTITHTHNIGHTHAPGTFAALICLRGSGNLDTRETQRAGAWTSNFTFTSVGGQSTTAFANTWAAEVQGSSANASMTGTVASGGSSAANTGSTTPGSTGGSSAANTGSTTPGSTGSSGSGKAHNNLQPYIVVYMWKRTA